MRVSKADIRAKAIRVEDVTKCPHDIHRHPDKPVHALWRNALQVSPWLTAAVLLDWCEAYMEGYLLSRRQLTREEDCGPDGSPEMRGGE